MNGGAGKTKKQLARDLQERKKGSLVESEVETITKHDRWNENHGSNFLTNPVTGLVRPNKWDQNQNNCSQQYESFSEGNETDLWGHNK